MTVPAIASLLIGLIIGYLGQRSRLCFVGGIRDFILARDTFLLKGLFSFTLFAWVAFPLLEGLAGIAPPAGSAIFAGEMLWVIMGGFGVGLVSVWANGCPFRQHVLAGQGTLSSWAYLAGFYAGAAVFHTLVLPWLLRLLP